MDSSSEEPAGTGGTDAAAGTDDAAARARLRRVGSSRRAALPAATRAAAAADAVARLAEHPRVRTADGVLLTAAIGDELDLAGLWPVLWDRGTTLALPRIEGQQLAPVAVTPATRLVPGWGGIPEPVGPPLDLDAGAWVALVPGLAFDRAGNRLGYGGGYFDRLLGAHPGVLAVGVCFTCQVLDDVPHAAHDVPMADLVDV